MTDDKEQGRAEALYDEQLQRQKQEKKIEEADPASLPPAGKRPPKR